ncbi:MAG: glycoside hydrolase family 78 protein [Lachnospiraceae bacterium]|nr:glycoside hydrolase family 78 protein [Lachnospiraceae bacterium]
MKATKLRVNYLENPIGIDMLPCFSWNVSGGISQSAYQIIAKSVRDNQLVWDSGKVVSDKMTQIAYEGRELESRDAIVWQVILWDENDIRCQESEEAYFEIGLLSATDWKASWITGDYKPNKKNRYPVDYFKRSFDLKGNVQFARIYATACGLYEIRINGKKAGDMCLAPGYTDYRKRIQYQTIDVTELFAAGAGQTYNMEIALADGWFRGCVGAHGIPYEYGTETKVMAQLELNYEDGSRDIIVTNQDFAWSNDGSIRFADNKDGERVDARMSPSYTGRPKIAKYPVVPSASNNVLLKENEQFDGKSSKAPSGKTLYNFGQNIAGYISFKVSARAGQLIRIRLGELLDSDGELTLKNIQTMRKGQPTPLQQVDYICQEGLNEYKTTFAIAGFQYAEVEFVDANTEDLKDMEASMHMRAYAVYSGIKEIGFFESSNEFLNQFVRATKWSVKGNSADIPTDCPTRERHGWTGDAQLFYKSAAYLFDYTAFAKKYLRDVYDWQKADGRLPQIAPYAGVDWYMNVMNGSVGWSDIGVFYPYQIYQMNGDKSVLEENYEGMKKYAHFMAARCGKWGGVYAKSTKVKGQWKKYVVNKGQSYDEWAEPQDVKAFVWTDFAEPHPEVSTAYTSYVMRHMVKIAEILGKKQDIDFYKEYEHGCKMAYQELIKSNPDYSIDTDRQARLVRPLYMNLLDDDQETFAKKRLIKAMENYGWRLGTGFLSTPFILDVLCGIDVEAAYKLLENQEIPGWLSMPLAGATTIWESWEGANAQGEVGSLNHYSKGALCEWLFRGMCGIKIAGDNTFEIRPMPGGHFAYAKASYDSVYGLVESGWTKQADGSYKYHLVVPANTRALVILPDGQNMELKAGQYDL